MTCGTWRRGNRHHFSSAFYIITMYRFVSRFVVCKMWCDCQLCVKDFNGRANVIEQKFTPNAKDTEQCRIKNACGNFSVRDSVLSCRNVCAFERLKTPHIFACASNYQGPETDISDNLKLLAWKYWMHLAQVLIYSQNTTPDTRRSF